MPWWLIWVLLVLAAIAALVWVGLRLWRSGKALVAELQRAAEVLERLESRMAELEAAEAAQGDATPRPEIVLDPQRRAELHAVRAEVRRVRRARKDARYARSRAAWDDITGPRA